MGDNDYFFATRRNLDWSANCLLDNSVVDAGA